MREPDHREEVHRCARLPPTWCDPPGPCRGAHPCKLGRTRAMTCVASHHRETPVEGFRPILSEPVRLPRLLWTQKSMMWGVESTPSRCQVSSICIQSLVLNCPDRLGTHTWAPSQWLHAMLPEGESIAKRPWMLPTWTVPDGSGQLHLWFREPYHATTWTMACVVRTLHPSDKGTMNTLQSGLIVAIKMLQSGLIETANTLLSGLIVTIDTLQSGRIVTINTLQSGRIATITLQSGRVATITLQSGRLNKPKSIPLGLRFLRDTTRAILVMLTCSTPHHRPNRRAMRRSDIAMPQAETWTRGRDGCQMSGTCTRKTIRTPTKEMFGGCRHWCRRHNWYFAELLRLHTQTPSGSLIHELKRLSSSMTTVICAGWGRHLPILRCSLCRPKHRFQTPTGTTRCHLLRKSRRYAVSAVACRRPKHRVRTPTSGTHCHQHGRATPTVLTLLRKSRRYVVSALGCCRPERPFQTPTSSTHCHRHGRATHTLLRRSRRYAVWALACRQPAHKQHPHDNTTLFRPCLRSSSGPMTTT
mmetsp:Transcript_29812/g.79256  ORF Transcript_29812/g.79256 Transcript_29812/m.79256 type:complete len:529 (-) Transcript_29812:683-2269(-)